MCCELHLNPNILQIRRVEFSKPEPARISVTPSKKISGILTPWQQITRGEPQDSSQATQTVVVGILNHTYMVSWTCKIDRKLACIEPNLGTYYPTYQPTSYWDPWTSTIPANSAKGTKAPRQPQQRLTPRPCHPWFAENSIGQPLVKSSKAWIFLQIFWMIILGKWVVPVWSRQSGPHILVNQWSATTSLRLTSLWCAKDIGWQTLASLPSLYDHPLTAIFLLCATSFWNIAEPFCRNHGGAVWRIDSEQSMFWRMFLVPAWLVDSGGESESGLPLAEFPMLLGLRLTGFTFNGCKKDHWTNRSFVLGPIQRTSKNRSGNFCQASMNINLNTLGRWQSWHHQQLWLQITPNTWFRKYGICSNKQHSWVCCLFFRITTSYQTGHSIGV